MPILLLAASITGGALGAAPKGAGQLDSTPGATYGIPLPCPGVFPAKITAKLSVIGKDSAVDILEVFAGPEHLVVKERVTRSIPSVGNRIRLVESSFGYTAIGGYFQQVLTTPNPGMAPYKGVRHLALKGLPPTLFSIDAYTVGSVIVPSTPASNLANYFQNYSTGFTNTLQGRLYEYGHALHTITSPYKVSVNFDITEDGAMSDDSSDLRADTYPYTTVSTNVFTGGNQLINTLSCLDLGVYDRELGLAIPSAMFPLFNMPVNERTLPGFTSINCSNQYFETDSIASGNAAGNSTGIQKIAIMQNPSKYYTSALCFLAINSNNRLFSGTLHLEGYLFPASNEFFNFTNISIPHQNSAYTLPPLGFAGNITTLTIGPSGYANRSKTLWSAAYPSTARLNTYLDVKATQYGFVLLESSTQQLQFMFTQHYAQLLPSSMQVISKMVHVAPRSVTWRSAWNMGLGINPGYTDTDSLYLDFPDPASFNADNHLHGGGGHLVALGTYNGILVHNNQVSVWGSNRWGQCVVPPQVIDYLNSGGGTAVDVAASIGPLLLQKTNNGFFPALDEQSMEKAAREYYDAPEGGYSYFYQTFRYGSYPAVDSVYTSANRHAGHVNYNNMSGHVCVLMGNGRVFCWGNNLYNQCNIPTEISLLDASGAIQTAALTDPVDEISCGGFHTVARTKGGAVYVWGAGSPGVSVTGYVTNGSGNPIRQLDVVPYTVSSSVHFGQAHMNGDQVSGILYAPTLNPNGIDDAGDYLTNDKYSNVSNVTGILTGEVVGQKTNAEFSVKTPIGKRLKGMIAAGAFHTAIIDSSLKIQCLGAGRGTNTLDDRGQIYRNHGTSGPSTPSTSSSEQQSMWGSSYDLSSNLTTYPHFCQGMSQYSVPQEPTDFGDQENIDIYRVNLLRQANTNPKRRPFQDLQFKKIVCGPFSTHGIVYSISRGVNTNPNIYNVERRVNAHGRVVSWGRARPSEAAASKTGPIGTKLLTTPEAGLTGFDTRYNPCVNLIGTGHPDWLVGMYDATNILLQEADGTPRHFSLLNRSNLTPTSEVELLVSMDDASNQDSSGNYKYCYPSQSPITISKFKVKDVSAGMDFAGYIGYMSGFQITDRLSYPEQALLSLNKYLAATFDFEASLFFVGGNEDWMPHIFNPHSGFYLVKRNKIGDSSTYPDEGYSSGVSAFEGNTALKVKTRSYYYGKLKLASGATVLMDDTPCVVNYVMPSTLQISSAGTVLIVNADNRPVAWQTLIREEDIDKTFKAFKIFPSIVNKTIKLDLSLLPSIPFLSVKTGKAHIAGITNGDWPIAKSLRASGSPATLTIPDVCSSLSGLISPTITGNSFPNSVLIDTLKATQPILWVWGAGDGRELGTGLFSGGLGLTESTQYPVLCCRSDGTTCETVASAKVCITSGGTIVPTCSSCGGSCPSGNCVLCCLDCSSCEMMDADACPVPVAHCIECGPCPSVGDGFGLNTFGVDELQSSITYDSITQTDNYNDNNMQSYSDTTDIFNLQYLFVVGPSPVPPGSNSSSRPYSPEDGGTGLGSNAINSYGMWFMDTHALTRYDDSLTGTPAGYATPPTSGNGEPLLITRNYKALTSNDGMTSAVNSYGEYRWHSQSDLTNIDIDLDFQKYEYDGNSPINDNSHAVESLQSKPTFNLVNYPTNPSTSLTGSKLLNGNEKAMVPVAYGRPWIGTEMDTMAAEAKKCCTTAAEATLTNEKLNHLQEWHGPLGLEIQNEVDYVVDYDVGDQTTAVLFASTSDYPHIETGQHISNFNNYLSYFTNHTNPLLRRFDKRRTCKVAIAGYGCENQTAGIERRLANGVVVPVVPRLFARDARVYCGSSYTAVTNPVRVQTFAANEGPQALNFTGGASKTFTFTIPAAKFSNRIRGVDVRMTFTCTGAANADIPVNLANWNVTIPYKNTQWIVLGNFQRWNGSAATPVTVRGTNIHDGTTLTSTYVFSDRYRPDLAYSYLGNSFDAYSEAGPVLSNISVNGSPYTLNPAAFSGNQLYPIIPTATSITNANQSLGCYAPYSYDSTIRATVNTWNYTDTSTPANTFLQFNEPTITLQITNSGATTNYTNLTLSVELVVEVADENYPLVIYGRKRAGVWRESFGEGPTYQADYFQFNANPLDVQRSCPCLLDSTLNEEWVAGRAKAVSFPLDSNFICGTKKYGPSGNPEIAANKLTIPVQEGSFPYGSDTNKILGPVISNFKAVFSKLMNRPLIDNIPEKLIPGPTLYALPQSAFIATSSTINLSSAIASMRLSENNPNSNVKRILSTTNIVVSAYCAAQATNITVGGFVTMPVMPFMLVRSANLGLITSLRHCSP